MYSQVMLGLQDKREKIGLPSSGDTGRGKKQFGQYRRQVAMMKRLCCSCRSQFAWMVPPSVFSMGTISKSTLFSLIA